MLAHPRLVALGSFFGAVLVTALILPQAASAWFLNSANANIARAWSLPPDAPARVSALSQADAQLTEARAWSSHPLVSLAYARLLLAQGESQRVVVTLQATGTALQDDFMAQFVWGDAEWQAGNPASAFERWRAAGALDYFMNQALRAAFRHQWKEAEDCARIAVGIASERAETHYYLGDALAYQSVANPEALREIDRAAELTNDAEFLSTILSRKGEVLAPQGKYQDALDLFAQAMKIAPRDARPRIGYAVTLWHLDPSAEKESIAILTQVVGDAPWTIGGHLALARIAEARGDLAGAEDWFRQGLAREPHNPDLLFGLGQFYARHNRVDDAKKMLTLALQYEPHADDLRAIARALAELNAR